LHYDAQHHPDPHPGETVARAKRTQRAEARRRNRAAAPEAAFEADESAPSPSTAVRGAQPVAKAPTTPQRMGFSAAFRAAIRPLNVRADLAALPWIATHTHALWVPVAITLASTIAIIATKGGDISLFMFAYFIQTPAIGGVFIAGFLAPRASWLLGAIVGLFSAICYSVLILAYPTTIYAAAAPPTQAQAQEVALSAFVLSPLIGAFFAAGAAWYRRFLRLSSPNRARPAQKSNAKKMGDGRTRGGTTAKASAKR
jgi:hypothetical protein